jgi:hypothetical protein
MPTTENKKVTNNKEIELEDLGPGIRGRLIPPEELELTEEQVKKLTKETGSEAFAEFMYRLYKIKPPKKE